MKQAAISKQDGSVGGQNSFFNLVESLPMSRWLWSHQSARRPRLWSNSGHKQSNEMTNCQLLMTRDRPCLSTRYNILTASISTTQMTSWHSQLSRLCQQKWLLIGFPQRSWGSAVALRCQIKLIGWVAGWVGDWLSGWLGEWLLSNVFSSNDTSESSIDLKLKLCILVQCGGRLMQRLIMNL